MTRSARYLLYMFRRRLPAFLGPCLALALFYEFTGGGGTPGTGRAPPCSC